ncbi:transposase [Micromonospora sp. NPDC050686]|uniref:IS110 family transposase n=1 Tax=Micromonospora sp. NPDC050686 TaxID=3154631 RepID=UPI0033DD8D4B
MCRSLTAAVRIGGSHRFGAGHAGCALEDRRYVSTHGRAVCWAVDVTTGLSALLLTLLWRRQVQVRYVSGTVAFHMAAAFARENKTDARDAVIAQTIRMRPDIPVLEPSDRLAELTVLTGSSS